MPGADDPGWHVYLARCHADMSLYCGVAKDVAARIAKHDAGRGARYTRGRRPVTLEFSAGPFTRGVALGLEARVKRLPKRRKLPFLRRTARQGQLFPGGEP